MKMIRRMAENIKKNDKVVNLLNNSVSQQKSKNGSFNQLFSPKNQNRSHSEFLSLHKDEKELKTDKSEGNLIS